MKLVTLASFGFLTFFGALRATESSFVIGKTDFRPGDSIRITNIQRGDTFLTVTADYELASHEEVRISLFITSNKGAGRVPVAPTQSKTIQKGKGTVVLHHPNIYEGKPHVSFYPAKGGSVLGGVYFSTPAEANAAAKSQAGTAPAPASTAFTVGNSSFRGGDSIKILSVTRNADLLSVTAEYRLGSQDKADLHLYMTNSEKGPAFDQRQAAVVSRGQGLITLHHPTPPPGQPHLTFYDPVSHQAIGGIYFGTPAEAAESKKYNLGYMTTSTK